MVNFHFDSKQSLLTATLKHIANEYNSAFDLAVERAAGDPVAALSGVIVTSLDHAVASPEKVAVWSAFWGETRARDEYLSLCGGVDAAQQKRIEALIKELVQREGRPLDAYSIAFGLSGVLDGLWQEILVQWQDFDRHRAIELCHRYLANFFPAFFVPPRPEAIPRSLPASISPYASLPASAYTDSKRYQLERTDIYRHAWHFMGHESEIPDTGCYRTLAVAGEHAFVIRGPDGLIRAFHNVAPHRPIPVVEGEQGVTGSIITIDDPGLAFDLKGAVRNATHLAESNLALRPVAVDVAANFIFVNFGDAPRLMSDRLAVWPANPLAGLSGLNQVVWRETCECGADWKAVVETLLYNGETASAHTEEFESVRIAILDQDPLKTASGAKDGLEQSGDPGQHCFLYPNLFLSVSDGIVQAISVLPKGPGRTSLLSVGYAAGDRLGRADWPGEWAASPALKSAARRAEAMQQRLQSLAYSRGMRRKGEPALGSFHEWLQSDVSSTEGDDFA